MENPAPRSYSKLWQSAILSIVIGVVALALLNRFKDPETVSYGLSSKAAGEAVIAASCSQADVQNAVNQAQDGDTVIIPEGTCSWASSITLTNSKGVSVVCANQGNCNINVNNRAFYMDTLSGLNNKLYRISGFTFNQSTSGFLIWFYGSGVMSQIRIDHNTLNVQNGTIAIFFGEVSKIANYYGVIDHNTLNSNGSAMLVHSIGTTNNAPPPSPMGTANNMFIEDNVVNISTMTNAGLGCVDVWGGGAYVWRHNTTTNCLVTSHGVAHNGGPQNFELYNNNLIVNAGSVSAGFADGYRLFHHQGSGEFIAFNNNFTAYSGKSGDPMEVTHYRSADPVAAGYSEALGKCEGTNSIDGNRTPVSTYFGYPCWRQPGRDFAGNLMPMYIWNNKWSDTGAKIDLLIQNPWSASSPSVSDHIKANRDYYNAVSASAQTSPTYPFTGASGVGFGTLAQRPTTCTPTPEALDAGNGGVGYFATDVGSQGALYRCASTNTWVLYYTPYTYPHPLVSGSSSTPPPPSPTPTPPPTPVTLSISSVNVTTNANSATIKWTTNVPSKASIYYGTSSNNLNLSTSETSYTTTHTITIPNLTKSARYYYQIRSANQDGTSTANSSIGNFRTKNK